MLILLTLLHFISLFGPFQVFNRVHATLYITLSVGQLVALLKFLPKSYQNGITAPAHPDATDVVVVYGLVLINKYG